MKRVVAYRSFPLGEIIMETFIFATSKYGQKLANRARKIPQLSFHWLTIIYEGLMMRKGEKEETLTTPMQRLSK